MTVYIISLTLWWRVTIMKMALLVHKMRKSLGFFSICLMFSSPSPPSSETWSKKTMPLYFTGLQFSSSFSKKFGKELCNLAPDKYTVNQDIVQFVNFKLIYYNKLPWQSLTQNTLDQLNVQKSKICQQVSTITNTIQYTVWRIQCPIINQNPVRCFVYLAVVA